LSIELYLNECNNYFPYLNYSFFFRLEWAKKELYNGKIINVVPLGVFTAGFGWQIDGNFVPFDNEEVKHFFKYLIILYLIKQCHSISPDGLYYC
jgi:hypothetical protein